MNQLKLQYFTSGRINETETSYEMQLKWEDFYPVKIFRSSVGVNGAAVNRYYYSAQVKAPTDAYSSNNGLIVATINRKTNPKFNPKKYKFINNIATI